MYIITYSFFQKQEYIKIKIYLQFAEKSKYML